MTFKKSLKIPNVYSESVYRRRTDNTMAKRRRTDITMANRNEYKQRSTKHTHKTKGRLTRTPLHFITILGKLKS